MLIDEISFMSVDLIAMLEQLRLKGVRLLAFGDFKTLLPACNRWRGQLVPSRLFENSRLFHQWSDGTRFVLRRCPRSDQRHFETYTRLRDTHLPSALAEARQIYPPPEAEHAADWHIFLSHAKRRRLNNSIQSRAAEQVPDDQKVWVDGETPYHCFVGTKLVGCNTTLKPIINGGFYVVTRVSQEGVGSHGRPRNAFDE